MFKIDLKGMLLAALFAVASVSLAQNHAVVFLGIDATMRNFDVPGRYYDRSEMVIHNLRFGAELAWEKFSVSGFTSASYRMGTYDWVVNGNELKFGQDYMGIYTANFEGIYNISSWFGIKGGVMLGTVRHMRRTAFDTYTFMGGELFRKPYAGCRFQLVDDTIALSAFMDFYAEGVILAYRSGVSIGIPIR